KAAPIIREAVGPELAPAFLGTIAGSNIAKMHLLDESQKRVVATQYTRALSRMWIFFTCIAGLGLIFSLFVKKRELSKKHEVTKWDEGTETGLAAQEQARQDRLAAAKEKKASKARRGERKDGGNPAVEEGSPGSESV